MSRLKTYHLPSGRRQVRINNADDLLETRHWGRHGIKGIKALTGETHERRARKQAKDLFHRMMGMIADDMVENNNTFVFPMREFGFMFIGNVSGLSGHYPYIIRFDGQMPGGRVVLAERIRAINGHKFYRFKLTRRRCSRMMELMENGHRYVDR